MLVGIVFILKHVILFLFSILADSFVTPLQECIDDWKKNCSQIEKDHTKGSTATCFVNCFFYPLLIVLIMKDMNRVVCKVRGGHQLPPVLLMFCKLLIY